MYLFSIIALMVVSPLLSIIIELAVSDQSLLGMGLVMALVGKWFVFWMFGVRLLLAGLKQIFQPRYTAETLLGIKDPGAQLIVRELGFANTTFGILGVLTLFATGWVVPAALVGCIFYAMAGINHVLRGHRNRLETVAMISDLGAAAVLLVYLVWVFLR